MSPYIRLTQAGELTSALARSIAEKDYGENAIETLSQLERLVKPGDGASRVVLMLTAIANYSRWISRPFDATLTRVDAMDTSLDICVHTRGKTAVIGKRYAYRTPIAEFLEPAARITSHGSSQLKLCEARKRNGALAAILFQSQERETSDAPPPSLGPSSMRLDYVP